MKKDSDLVILTEYNFSKLKEQIKKLQQAGCTKLEKSSSLTKFLAKKSAKGDFKANQSVSKANVIIFSSEDDELNRKVLEKLPIHALLINQTFKKDYAKQRNSGFNQVMAKVARKNNIVIAINLDEIIESEPILRTKIIARIKQNIKLCNKNKVKMTFLSITGKNKRDERDQKALGVFLGMPTWMFQFFN